MVSVRHSCELDTHQCALLITFHHQVGGRPLAGRNDDIGACDWYPRWGRQGDDIFWDIGGSRSSMAWRGAARFDWYSVISTR